MIEQANPSDFAQIVRIYNQAIAAGSQTADEVEVSLEEKRPWLEKHTGEHYIIYVMRETDKVIGYLAVSPYRYGRSVFRETAEISYYLDKDYQGKGVGTALIDYAIDQCPALNIKTLIAIMLSCNKASIATMRKFSFHQWGSMPKVAILNGNYIDHLYYGRHLK